MAKTCGAEADCKDGYVPVGKCTTKCTETQYVKADKKSCVQCDTAKGALVNANKDGCKCTATDQNILNKEAATLDCSCKSKAYDVEKTAYK